MNVVGAPYVPELIRLQRELGKRIYLVGGAMFNPGGLKDTQRVHLFGEHSINGNNDTELRRILGGQNMPLPEETSLIPIYKQVPDVDFKTYLEHEMCFYLSQGCKENCTFCAAQKGQAERYRKEEIVERDLEYLIQRTVRLDVKELKIYVSNLDLCQTPEKLRKWVKLLLKMAKKYPNLKINWRALATTISFNAMNDEDLAMLKESGLRSIGFGLDGAREETWRSINKDKINSTSGCLRAVERCREKGITPEALMVFGHPKETPETLKAALEFMIKLQRECGAIPRPHIAKSIYPGNGAWRAHSSQPIVRILMENPTYFQALDFTALASSVSHHYWDESARKILNHYFIRMCELPECSTKFLYPRAPENERLWETYRRLNQGKFDL